MFEIGTSLREARVRQGVDLLEAEVLGIRAEEALDVRLRGQNVELLVLEGAQILPSNLRSLLELGKVEALAQTRLAEAVTDFEHGGKPILGAQRECW